MHPATVVDKPNTETAVIRVTDGVLKDKSYTIRLGGTNVIRQLDVQKGDKVVVSVSKDQSGAPVVYITDYQRGDVLIVLAALFLVTVLAISRMKGVRALIAMGFSFVILMRFILPQIVAGNNPVIISLLGALLIIPVSFYISHGLNRKTTVSLIGTFAALIITGILSYIFVMYGKITGFASEESMFLQAQGAAVDIRSALLAGILIAGMGILDDVTISQAAVVEKLHETNPSLGASALFKNAMDIGRDHISSLVNTLVLVYAGASLPLFLLFYITPLPYGMVINQEMIATEIIRTLVSSIGIILAVPVTTYIAAYFYKN